MESTTKGFLPSRMTAIQMNAIVYPAEGLIVYCTDCTPKGVHIYDGSTYVNLMPPEASATLNCGGTSVMGTATSGEALSGVTITIPYTEGNGVAYNAVTVASTGVTGLTATLAAGTLANGSGDLVLQVTGTPSGAGDALFTIDTGVSSSFCAVTITVVGTVDGRDTTTAVVDVTSSTGAIWMDRSLGATQAATSSTDTAAYGDLYQWGRAKDGHEQRTSTSTTTIVTSADPGHGDFILGSAVIDDNWTNFADEDNLWQGESGINNPCPNGYRLPTIAEWDTERLSWISNDAGGAFFSNLKLSLAGRRNSTDGYFYTVSATGYYWSSTISGSKARFLFFDSSGAGNNDFERAYGYSVRCIKD